MLATTTDSSVFYGMRLPCDGSCQALTVAALFVFPLPTELRLRFSEEKRYVMGAQTAVQVEEEARSKTV